MLKKISNKISDWGSAFEWYPHTHKELSQLLTGTIALAVICYLITAAILIVYNITSLFGIYGDKGATIWHWISTLPALLLLAFAIGKEIDK